jgi:hypothetical protein
MSTLALIVLLASLAPVILVGAIAVVSLLVEQSIEEGIGR